MSKRQRPDALDGLAIAFILIAFSVFMKLVVVFPEAVIRLGRFLNGDLQ